MADIVLPTPVPIRVAGLVPVASATKKSFAPASTTYRARPGSRTGLLAAKDATSSSNPGYSFPAKPSLELSVPVVAPPTAKLSADWYSIPRLAARYSTQIGPLQKRPAAYRSEEHPSE